MELRRQVRYAVSLVFVDRHVGLTAVVALTLALVSYVSSYHARVFDVYKVPAPESA